MDYNLELTPDRFNDFIVICAFFYTFLARHPSSPAAAELLNRAIRGVVATITVTLEVIDYATTTLFRIGMGYNKPYANAVPVYALQGWRRILEANPEVHAGYTASFRWVLINGEWKLLLCFLPPRGQDGGLDFVNGGKRKVKEIYKEFEDDVLREGYYRPGADRDSPAYKKHHQAD